MNFLNRLSNLKNKTKKFNFNVRNKNNYNFDNYNKYVTLTTPNKKANLTLGLKNTTIYYAHGHTNKNMRRRGYGTLLRAIPILAAKNTKFKKMYHIAVFMNNNQRKNYNKPPSLKIVRSLGFKPMPNYSNNNGVSELNLSNVNYNKIKKIIGI